VTTFTISSIVTGGAMMAGGPGLGGRLGGEVPPARP